MKVVNQSDIVTAPKPLIVPNNNQNTLSNVAMPLMLTNGIGGGTQSNVTENSGGENSLMLGESFLRSCIASAWPKLAGPLFEQMNAHKLEKKYDMKLQKEISELQGKQLLYTCPGLQVVSSDGPGIESDAPTPTATNVTMNQRFA